jgi:hypothetical protein
MIPGLVAAGHRVIVPDLIGMTTAWHTLAGSTEAC